MTEEIDFWMLHSCHTVYPPILDFSVILTFISLIRQYWSLRRLCGRWSRSSCCCSSVVGGSLIAEYLSLIMHVWLAHKSIEDYRYHGWNLTEHMAWIVFIVCKVLGSVGWHFSWLLLSTAWRIFVIKNSAAVIRQTCTDIALVFADNKVGILAAR